MAGGEEAGQRQGLRPFTRLTKASVEGLRYRGEDIARSLTKSAIKEVSKASRLHAIWSAMICVLCTPMWKETGWCCESLHGKPKR